MTIATTGGVLYPYPSLFKNICLIYPVLRIAYPDAVLPTPINFKVDIYP
jgi:hypothetical protein